VGEGPSAGAEDTGVLAPLVAAAEDALGRARADGKGLRQLVPSAVGVAPGPEGGDVPWGRVVAVLLVVLGLAGAVPGGMQLRRYLQTRVPDGQRAAVRGHLRGEGAEAPPAGPVPVAATEETSAEPSPRPPPPSEDIDLDDVDDEQRHLEEVVHLEQLFGRELPEGDTAVAPVDLRTVAPSELAPEGPPVPRHPHCELALRAVVGCDVDELAVKSVSGAEDETCGLSSTGPVTSRGSSSGGVV
jgi:hypothetical protein